MKNEIFFIRLNLDEFGNAMLALDTDEERGRWVRGFQIGASGAPPRDSWLAEMTDGWVFGSSAREEAFAHLENASRAGKASADARKQKYGSANPNANTVRTAFEHTSEQTHEHDTNQSAVNSQQLTAMNEERESDKPKALPKRTSREPFKPPTEQEWLDHCQKTYPTWRRQAASSAWAYYESIGWRTKVGPIKNWKACAYTCKTRARPNELETQRYATPDELREYNEDFE